MEEIIAPIPKELLKSELTEDKRLRFTQRSNNEIYIFTAADSPHLMQEVGRLREIAFRAAGGGTGKSVDIDEYDTMENPYKQMIVWNPDADEIIGGYRFISGADVRLDETGTPILATAHNMFNFSKKFIEEYLPVTVELGRSFVAVEYQSTRMGSKSIYALDNLWDGLGALAVTIPNVKYLFGKVTMYPSYPTAGRDMILYFLNKYFSDPQKLIAPMSPLLIETDPAELEKIFVGGDFKSDFRILKQEVRQLGYSIPPLVNAYMGLSPTMRIFGTAVNTDFGNVEETGIFIAVDEMIEQKRVRYIDSFAKEYPEAVKITSGANKVFYPSKGDELPD